MKIAFVHNNCKIFRLELFKILDEKYNIDFLLLQDEGVTLKKVKKINSVRIPNMQDLVIPTNLYSILKKGNYDLVISTDLGYGITYISYMYSKLNGAKFMLWNEQWHHINHPRRLLTRIFEKKICKESDWHLAFGNKQKVFLKQNGALENKITHVPNSLNEKSIPESTSSYLDECSVNSSYILCLARLVKFKGHSTLLDAFKLVKGMHKDVKLVLAGEGPEYSFLKNKCSELALGDSIIMPNKQVGILEKKELIERASFVILPSEKTKYLTITEAWGLVVNEAALLKKAVIVGNETGVADDLIIDNYSGLIFESGNRESLAEKILFLLNNDNEKKIFEDNLYQMIKNQYSLDESAKMISFAINGCMESDKT